MCVGVREKEQGTMERAYQFAGRWMVLKTQWLSLLLFDVL